MNAEAADTMPSPPRVVVLAGPNGAGKTTTARSILQEVLGVDEFVNADQIALGLAGFTPDSAAIEASGLMLERLQSLARRRANFAFETTLSSRTYAPWLRTLIADGYCVHLVFIWLPSPEMSILRVRERVRRGGHDVPDDTIRRRYARGISNFFELYRPLAIDWRILDNSGTAAKLIASGCHDVVESVVEPALWKRILASQNR